MSFGSRFEYKKPAGGGDRYSSRGAGVDPRGETVNPGYAAPRFTSFRTTVSEGSSASSYTGVEPSILRPKKQLYVDVAFLVDVTSSMQPWIDAVHQKLDEIIDEISKKFPTAILRSAFVGYRDVGDSVPVVAKDFQNDTKELKEFVRSVAATGGADEAEDVFTGIDAVLGLSWASRYRHVIHVADAPPHGREFHGPSVGDSYPNGLPGERRSPEDLLCSICEKRIQYNFLQLNETTNEMVVAFNRILSKYHKRLSVTSLKSPASEFVPAVVGSIASSLPPDYTI